MTSTRQWVAQALQRIEADARRSADTHLIPLALPEAPGVDVYFKDESTHPSGSLKHRLARSLFLYGLCNGHIGPGTTIVESSSGSTAISEAYFARLLGLPFIAVVPFGTAPRKLQEIAFFGGQSHEVEASEVYAAAEGLARERRGHYMDQFTHAERATDWRGNNNIAESILGQLRREPQPVPTWIVCGVGTGGTSATIGRYLRYRRLDTRLCVAEPTGSSYVHGWRTRDRNAVASQPTRIEGIGRPKVEPGFLFDVVDDVVEVDDAAAIAGALQLESLFGTQYGGSSGVNLIGCLQLASAMRARGETGSIVSLLCDRGKRYQETLFDPAWRAERGLDIAPWQAAIARTLDTGVLAAPVTA